MTTMTEQKRAWFYRIAVGVILIAAIVGRITGHAVDNDTVTQISDALAFIFGIGAAGLATKNTSTQIPE